MCKRLLFAIAFLPLVCIAQQNDFGHVSNDTLYLNNGSHFTKGDVVHLGYGSNGFKGFEFISLSPYSLAGPQKLGSAWANHTMTVKKIEFAGAKKTGKSFYIVLAGGNLSPYWCDINSAMETGEVIVSGINDKKALAGKESSTKESPLDQLKKLTDLLDAGAINQHEYDSLKNSILKGNN